MQMYFRERDGTSTEKAHQKHGTRTHFVLSVPDAFSSPVDRPRYLARQLPGLVGIPV